ncbi:16766_t:CDS:2, partial [Gigaspora rosea]
MGELQIVIDPDEACSIEQNLILQEIYYRPTGYFSNPKSLRNAYKKEGYRFSLQAVEEWLNRQESYRIYKCPSKHVPSHWETAIVERFNQTLSKILYKIQYAIESISSNSRLIRAWVRYLPKAIDYLNNYPTRLIREPGSLKWGLAPSEAILLEKVESRPSIKSKRPVRKNEETLKKGDTIRYLLANAEWEG